MAGNQIKRRAAIGLAASGIVATGFAYWFYRNRVTDRSRIPKLRMQSPWVNDAEFIGYFVGLHNDWYKEEGVNFEYLPGGPEVIVEGSIMSNQAEIGLAPLETVAKLVQLQNAPLVIIGTQYQKSPVGIVSLSRSPIESPKDLIGKRLAVPPANLISVEALLRLNGIDKEKLQIVPYQYDPSPLLNGDVDATLDFVTNVPYTINSKSGGEVAVSFLLHDFGFKVFNDVIIVKKDLLQKRRPEVLAWMRASRRGWQENFLDPEKYPKLFMESWFKGTGRSVDNEIFFNKAQQSLIEDRGGIFSMSKESIDENIGTLAQIGITIDSNLFDTSVLEELK